MVESKTYIVRVPATTANIGSGFDTLGMSLGLYNVVQFVPEVDRKLIDTEIRAEGEGVDQIAFGMDNMIIKAMAETAERAGKEISGGKMYLINRIPFARGLGSSSAALASGVFLANMLMGEPFDRTDILNITADMEGHPDNAAPAILGGFCMALLKNGRVTAERIDIPSHWKAVVTIPDFELHTEKARAVLPQNYSRSDAVHNIGAVSFLMAAFMYQKPEYLKFGLDDCIHVPYRLELIPGAKQVIANAMYSGAYGATISGSGPTIIAFAPASEADKVGKAMVEGFNSSQINARYLVLDFDQNGIMSV
jgi:homoserine kinase